MLKTEILEEDYRKHFKPNCICCFAKIPARWYWYKVRGNFCDICTGVIQKYVNNLIFKEDMDKFLDDRRAKNVKRLNRIP